MSFKKRVKDVKNWWHVTKRIPKELRKVKGAERIEIRYPLTLNQKAVGILPKYQIRAVGEGRDVSIGDVYVSTDRLSSNRGKYLVRAFYDTPKEKATIVGERDNLADADHLAYQTALDIAHAIAKENHLRLENLAMEDQDKIEEDELELKIRMLKWKNPVSILFLLGGIALVLSSLTATGNTVSNLTGTSQGLLGIFFFVAGLAGLVFGRK